MYSSVSCMHIAVLAPEEGIYLTLKALLNPGDHVVVTYPGYQSLYEVARSIGCTTSYWQPERQAQGHWSFDPEDLRSIMQPDTKLPTAVDSYERGISLCGMSKAFSMPGLRVGWVAMHDTQLLQRIVQLKDYTTICSSAPSEVLALMGLRNQHTILARNHRLMQQNLALLRAFFQRRVNQFEWAEPAGSSVAFPRLISGEKVDHFCSRCVSEAGVLLLPGSQFADSSEDGCATSFRVGYGRENMGECLEKLDSYLSSCQEL